LRGKLTSFAFLCLLLILLTGCHETEEPAIDNEALKAQILNYFTDITEVPRESGQSKAISTYLRSWADSRGYQVIRDRSYNIIIEKPATEGYEDAPLTILHSNMDTISMASEGVLYDPLNDSIVMINDGESLFASGTSLGADSGIGIATAMYILENAPHHGPLRVIFTANGETSKSGAKGLNDKHLKGASLINLNGEKDKTIQIGSPDTHIYKMSRHLTWTEPKNALPYIISIKGLSGGSFLLDENKDKANAVKILGETLANIQGEGILFELAAINGGTEPDQVPTEASAMILINENDVKKFNRTMDRAVSNFASKYNGMESNHTFTYEEAAAPDKVVTLEDTGAIISFIYGILNGVQTQSSYDEQGVECASNLGMVSTSSGDFLAEAYVFCSTNESETNIAEAHMSISSMCDMEYSYENTMPGWIINPEDPLVTIIKDIALEQAGVEYKVGTGSIPHECGWFYQKNPDLKIISIGPRIHNANTPSESLVLDTVALPARIILSYLEQTK
jgi:dipeptidase D